MTKTVQEGTNRSSTDKSTKYALCHEIQCQSTVGSLAIGYDDLYSDQQQPGHSNKRNQGRYAKIMYHAMMKMTKFSFSP